MQALKASVSAIANLTDGKVLPPHLTEIAGYASG